MYRLHFMSSEPYKVLIGSTTKGMGKKRGWIRRGGKGKRRGKQGDHGG